MKKPLLAITQGDPAGIGPEVALKAFFDPLVRQICTPVILGDRHVFERLLASVNLGLPTTAIDESFWIPSLEDLHRPGLYHVETGLKGHLTPGHVNRETGHASYRYIETSIELAMSGRVDAVVTGPVHKEALKMADVPYPGHTEIYTAKTGANRSCMMLTSPELTCSFVTTHVGLNVVPGLINQKRVEDVIELSHNAMKTVHGRIPKIVVCGLNPHAGEGGLFGAREEERFIIPAIEACRARGMDIIGPLPPDTAFLPGRRKVTDCFVCMYHDQGHIPLKALAFDQAVNTTLGLPMIRTSVDHGTALDIAWQGKADQSSMIEAIKLAVKLCGDRDDTHVAAHSARQAPIENVVVR